MSISVSSVTFETCKIPLRTYRGFYHFNRALDYITDAAVFMYLCFSCGVVLGLGLRGDTAGSKMLNGPGSERP